MPVLATLVEDSAARRHLRGTRASSVASESMATTRFRFSAESLAALGVTVDTSPDELTARLGFPRGVKVTSAKADGDGAVLNISGATLPDGTEASGGEVTGSFTVTTEGRTVFEGFRSVAGGADASESEAAATPPPT